MASKPFVEMTFGGDATGLQRSMAKVGEASKEMAADFDSSAGKMKSSAASIGNGVADSIDSSERKFQGFGDTIEGTGDIMEGFRTGNVVQVARGFADLAGGITDFVVPAFKAMAARVGAMIGLTTTQTAATGTATAAQWSLNTALSANPIGAVILAVVALIGIVVLLIKNWDTVKKALGAVWDWMKGAASSVKDWVVGRFNDLIGFIGSLPGKIGNVARGMFDGIKEAFKSALNWIIDRWNGLEFKIPGFDPPGPGPTFGGFTLGVPDLPRFAMGGNINGLGIVGEEGPELFAGRGTIIPNHALGGMNVTVIVQGSVVTERQLVDAVHSGLLKKQSRSGGLGFNAN